MSPPPPTLSTCSSKAKPGRTLSLPVLAGGKPGARAGHDRNAWEPGHSKIRHSRVGKWRAWVLIGVHVVFAIHLAQWLIAGLTLSPVEPSESMFTLRDGVVNAGFVFFALAILSTLLFGRFFCGWGCHIVAVQDLCAWMMMRAGIKPKPFRSRLLLLVPLGLALYMFAWPVAARLVLRPLLTDAQGRWPWWLGPAGPLPGVRSEFFVQDFWATFAPWYVAIPFIFVCGAMTVYFLGAKAFCTYGCPYGGVFGPVDLLAPGRIRVTDACEHCGHCTAVCTSNVRVHEEVRDFGMVVDPGCMKCLDCISVCPNDALYLGLGRPALLAGVRQGAKETAARAKTLKQARYDLAWPEEIVVAVLFVALFWCYRAMFNQVPMLMAVAMGGLGAWATWKTWRLVRDANSRVHGFQFKRAGRLTGWGAAFVAATVTYLAAGAWSGYIRWHQFRAQYLFQQFQTPTDVVLGQTFAPTPREVEMAREGLEHYRIASPAAKKGGEERGGVAFWWTQRPDDLLNAAYLRLVLGDLSGAERTIDALVHERNPKDAAVFQLAQVKNAIAQREINRQMLTGVAPEQIKAYQDAAQKQVMDLFTQMLAKHDGLMGVRDQVLRRRAAGDPVLLGGAGGGDVKGAMEEWSSVLKRHPRDIVAHLTAAAFFADVGAGPAASATLEQGLALHGVKPDQYLQASAIAARAGDRKLAVALAIKAADEGLKLPGPRVYAAQQLVRLGEPEKATEQLEQGLKLARMTPPQEGSTGAILAAGHTFNGMGKPERGMELIREAVGRMQNTTWDLVGAGIGMRETARQVREQGQLPGPLADQLLGESIKALERARTLEPESAPIRYDLAVAYYYAQRGEDALREMRAAADGASRSSFLADQVSKMSEDLGQHNEASRWRETARERAAAQPLTP